MSKIRQLSSLTIKEIATKLNEGPKIECPTPAKIGVLLINTGTPSGFSFWPMWSYLRQFLSDRRISEVPRVIWYPILYLLILTTRPFKKAPSYKAIWNKERDESPLRTVSRNQADQLQSRFDARGEATPIKVEWAFRYGTPSIDDKIGELHASGCDRLVAFPLFPQYAAPTTGSCCDEVFRALLTQRKQMAVHTVHAYYGNDKFILNIVKSLQDAFESYQNVKFDAIIATYHGIPLRFHERGDPYGQQCHETTALIQKELNHRGINTPLITTFQSRMGRSVWLQPYTDKTVVEIANNGYRNIIVIAPGFSSDCLETLEELEMELADDFRKRGGKLFVYVKCLNDSEAGIDVIEDITRKEIQGFL